MSGGRRAALAALKELSLDDSRKVANAAAEALKAHDNKNTRSEARDRSPPQMLTPAPAPSRG